jgi:NAD(P)H-hydrate epimerase
MCSSTAPEPMVLRPLSRAEVRGIDASAAGEVGLPTVVLMENAGRGAAEVLLRCLAADEISCQDDGPPRILILCGPGNNGGDGGVVARHLDLRGLHVRVVWFADPAQLRGDAAVQWSILERSGVDQMAWPVDPATDPARLDALLAAADWVVDALLGTGLARPVEGTLLHAIEAINGSGKPVLALDLPSGLDADQGVPLGVAVRATATATFVAPKLGFNAPGAQSYTGAVTVVDIGAPRSLLEPFRASGPG